MATADDHTLMVAFDAKFDRMQRSLEKQYGAVISKLDKLEREGSKRFDALDKAAGAAFSKMTGYAKAFLATWLSISGVKAFASFITSSLDAAAAIKDVANEANASTTYVQEMRYALSQAGGDAESMDDALVKLNKNLGEFRTSGAGPAKLTLEQLGLAARVMNGEFESTDDAMDAVLRALMNVRSESDRTAMASDLFGKAAGPRLAELLANGEQGLEDAKRKAHELGLILSGEMINAADDASDKLNELQQIIGTKLTEAVVKFAPEILALAQNIADSIPTIVTWVTEWGKWLGILERTPAEIRKNVEELDKLIQKNKESGNLAAQQYFERKKAQQEGILYGMDPSAGGLLRSQLQYQLGIANDQMGAGRIDRSLTFSAPNFGFKPQSGLGRGQGGLAQDLKNQAAAAKAAEAEAERLAETYGKLGYAIRDLMKAGLDDALDTQRGIMDQTMQANDAAAEAIRDQKRELSDVLMGVFYSKDLKSAALYFVDYLASKMYRKLADALADAIIDGTGSAGGGGSGIFGQLIGAIFGSGGGSGAAAGINAGLNAISMGWAGGGYTGNGPASQVAGPVHRGEYVFDAAAVRRIGLPNLEAMRSGRSGSYTFAPVIDARGATPEAIARLERVMSAQQAEFRAFASGERGRVQGYVNDGARRNQVAA